MNLLINRTTPALALLGLGLAGCQPDIDAPTASTGSANFSSYVAVGNSLTSGYSDGGLYNEAQSASYPALLAQQFAKTGKGPANFVQPSFSAAKKDGSGYIKLLLVNGALTPVQPTPPPSTTNPNGNSYLGEAVAFTGNKLAGSGQDELEAYSGNQPDNLGVPGISVLSADKTASSTGVAAIDAATRGAAAAYGIINPFYQRLLPAADRGTKDYVTYIGQKSATFFTCWMGNNDVLTYATNGAVVDAANPFSGLTDTTSFGKGYRNIVATISKNGTVGGVCANIPNVTGIPYFNTVTVAAVAAAFKAQNAASPGVFISVAGTTPVRLATSADLLTLTAQAYIAATGAGSTPTNPLPSKYVLDAAEVTTVINRTNQLNAIIAKTARQNKVALADMNTFFNTISQSGFVTSTVNNSATFASGNLFSLDGVHPTPRGYAVVANEFIRVINDFYRASVPTVNPNNYRGAVFPQ
ncbi:SGNH/GDSL hydrolase family protein [Hymenobacter sp. DH14]|uniref:SGNH/GDSL hydrolase family protein n=1 Tax=Hymenobacter cyanobacteriorum TaxID=2926463 RepID=A0A9X2AG17_9BACT|nr:SGNH/GDSL hydrolase family protein [Hymenobacter cyanobacteriorum]MCI1188377.1 SGNH/GDSL hydrolase family protein [Hymenobacter cyanobacteriorum]